MIYQLFRDGKLKGTFESYWQLVNWYHRNSSCSLTHGIKFEGWEVKEIENENRI